jgi:lysophospholipase L1-like esterase
MNRFLRRLTVASVLGALGWAGVLVSVVVLSRPVAIFLFSRDGATLSRPLETAFEWTRLATGVLGLLLLGPVRSSRRLAEKHFPLRSGDLALWGTVALLALVLAEGWLRWRGARDWGSATRTPLTVGEMRRASDVRLQPGVYAQRVRSDFDAGYDRVVFFSVNRYGLRGTLPAVPKPPGRRRIACVGGSTTLGYSVTDGEDWPTRLGGMLGGSFEVLNAGRPGATTYRNFAYLRDYLLDLEPEVVVLYEGFNDMWRGVRRHGGDQPDYGMVDEGLPPKGEALDRGEPASWPWRLSFVAYRGARGLERLLSEPPPPWPEPPVRPGPFRFDPAIVSIYERNLGAMVRLCRSRGVQPVIATFAGCDDPTASPAERRRRLRYVLEQIPQLDEATAQHGMDMYREATRRLAQSEHVTLVDSARLMTKDLDAYTDTVHFTPAGELQLAQLLAATIRQPAPAREQAAEISAKRRGQAEGEPRPLPAEM